MKRSQTNQNQSFKKQKIQELEIPKDCLSIVFSYLDLSDLLKYSLVSKDWKEIIILNPRHQLYSSFLNLCISTFLLSNIAKNDKTKHFIHFKSWIKAKKFVLNKKYEHNVKKWLNICEIEKSISLIQLDYDKSYPDLLKSYPEKPFQNTRSHYRINIKKGTYIDLICAETFGEEEISIANCYSDCEYDFEKLWNIKKDRNNIIFLSEADLENGGDLGDCFINYSFLNSLFDFLKLSNKTPKHFLREFSFSRKRKTLGDKNFISLDFNGWSHNLGFDKEMDDLRLKYFQKFIEKIDNKEINIKTFQLLNKVLKNTFSRYKHQIITFKSGISLFNVKGYINECGEYRKHSLKAKFDLHFENMIYNCEIKMFQQFFYEYSFDGHEGDCVFTIKKDNQEIELQGYFCGVDVKAHWVTEQKDIIKMIGIRSIWYEFRKELFKQLSEYLPVYNIHILEAEEAEIMFYIGEIS